MRLLDEGIVKKFVYKKFIEAKESLDVNKSFVKLAESAISDRIPNYPAKYLDFAAYKKDTFVAFFVDVRKSTKRSQEIGIDQTFLTMHAIIPTMIYIVEAYGGYIIDIPGDGIMALFKDNPKGIHRSFSKQSINDETIAVDCAYDIFEVFKEIVNPLLVKNDIPAVNIGIGADSGEVIVTKIGTDKNFDTKAIGDCINSAAKNATGHNQLFISQSIFDKIPASSYQNNFSKHVTEDGRVLFIEKKEKIRLVIPVDIWPKH